MDALGWGWGGGVGNGVRAERDERGLRGDEAILGGMRVFILKVCS